MRFFPHTKKCRVFAAYMRGMHIAAERGHDGCGFHLGYLRVLRNGDRVRVGVHTLMTPWELVMGSVMAVGLTVYLIYAMLRPEKF